MCVKASVLRWLVFCAVGGVLAIGLDARAANVAMGAAQAVPLFADVAANDAARTTQDAPREGERRRRTVRVNLDALGGFYGAGPAESRIELTLFNSETRTAVLDRLETTFEGRSWIGQLEGIELSTVILTVTRGAMSGSVSWPGGHQFGIAPGLAGTHVVVESDPAAQFRDEVIEPLPGRSERVSVDPRIGALDDPSVIDILVIYTAAARQQMGGYAGMAAVIDERVSGMNRALANSRVPTRVRVVQTLEMPFGRRATCFEAVRSLSTLNDGNLDEVGALRDAYGADVVHLFDYPRWDTCSGAANYANTPQLAEAYSVSAVYPGVPTFEHELGHTFGARHGWFLDDTRNSGKGHSNCAAGWADLMDVGAECFARGVQVFSIFYFSNPSVLYEGQPTGIPRGTGLGCRAGSLNNPPCDADNARTMADSLPAIANHRPSRFLASNFPPRNESFDFRGQLEAKYRDALRRPVAGSYADPEGAVVWTVEYLRYRLGQCGHEVAVDKVRRQVQRLGLPEPCGSASAGSITFPPRNETYNFRLELENMYRVDLRRSPSDTRVDPEGDVVWIQEYLRYRLTGCNHSDAVARSMLQVDGQAAPPTCR